MTVPSEIAAQGVASLAYKTVFTALKKAKGFPENKVVYLPQYWRAVYTLFYLDSEVCNGGFHQFFWNSENSLNDWLLEDLEFVGSSEIKQIVCEALRLHRGYDYPQEKKAAELSWDAFTQGYDEERFETCDSAYYSSKEKLLDLLGEAIKNNAMLYEKTA
jgi:hypothetical protein